MLQREISVKQLFGMKFRELCIQTRIFLPWSKHIPEPWHRSVVDKCPAFSVSAVSAMEIPGYLFPNWGPKLLLKHKIQLILRGQVNFWHRSVDFFPLSWCFYISFTSEVLQILANECDGRKKYTSLRESEMNQRGIQSRSAKEKVKETFSWWCKTSPSDNTGRALRSTKES